MTSEPQLGIVGAGAFGTALAISISNTTPLYLWGRDEKDILLMRTGGQSGKRLPGFPLPHSLIPTHQQHNLSACKTLLLCVPMANLIQTTQSLNPNPNVTLIACCKGLDPETGQGPASLLQHHFPQNPIGLISGPGFAKDIAAGLPTAQTLACTNQSIATTLQHGLSNSNLRFYTNKDIRGVELGGALKNVGAIGCGAVMGAGLGESARASLLNRIFREMMQLCQDLGGQSDTMMGMAGFGDLVLTCTGPSSRNYTYGYSLGQGTLPNQQTTVEGVRTAKAINTLKQKNHSMPSLEAIARLCEGTPLTELVGELMGRPLKSETLLS